MFAGEMARFFVRCCILTVVLVVLSCHVTRIMAPFLVHVAKNAAVKIAQEDSQMQADTMATHTVIPANQNAVLRNDIKATELGSLLQKLEILELDLKRLRDVQEREGCERERKEGSLESLREALKKKERGFEQEQGLMMQKLELLEMDLASLKDAQVRREWNQERRQHQFFAFMDQLATSALGSRMERRPDSGAGAGRV